MAHAMTLQDLHDEIEADPEALGYKEVGGEWKEDEVIAALINAKNYKVDKETVPQELVRSNTRFEAYDGLLLDRQEWLVWLTPANGDLMVTSDVKLQLTGRTMCFNGVGGTGSDGDSFWPLAENDTASIMLALIEIDGSRAEVLWGEGTLVGIGDVAHAANL